MPRPSRRGFFMRQSEQMAHTALGQVAGDVCRIVRGNKSRRDDLTLCNFTQSRRRELARTSMDSRISKEIEQIDRKTLRAVCDGVGERLQQYIRPETTL